MALVISRQIFHRNQVLLELWLCWRDFTKHFVGQRAKWRMSLAKCQSWVLVFVHCIGISVLDLEKKHLVIFTLLPAPHPGSWARWRSPCCPCSPSSAASPLPSSSRFPCFLTKSKFYLFHQVWLICFLTNTKSSQFVFPKHNLTHQLNVNGTCFSLGDVGAQWQALGWTPWKRIVHQGAMNYFSTGAFFLTPNASWMKTKN